MDIQGKSVLIIGGWGLVGTAVARKIISEKPRNIILTSLRQQEAEEAVLNLQQEHPELPANFFIPWWGNIFVRTEYKDLQRDEVLGNEEKRMGFISDILDELSPEILHRSALYDLLISFHPEIVIDCVNSATGIAYQDIFQTSIDLRKKIFAAKKGGSIDELIESAERLLSTLYVPQLIRHVQIYYRSMHEAGTRIYLKIGTSGTGGMGLNIPYTHSEDRPSRVLLSKSSVAGAHTLLLFLMGRTPDAPITKEIKPTAAIAWKKIGVGEIKKGGRPVQLEDCPVDSAVTLGTTFDMRAESAKVKKTGKNLVSVFIDTGENGIFSRGEFEAISTPGQMELVTPEEIAEDVVYEIKGGNTGHDIINALDDATMGPTYRAGFLHRSAITYMRQLEAESGKRSIAFEMLGPPRLSKLLYEAHLLNRVKGSINAVLETPPEELSRLCQQLIEDDSELRSEIISIGIPILLNDGVSFLRGSQIKIPSYKGETVLPVTPESINAWTHDGWVDLRTSNMTQWIYRFKSILEEAASIPKFDTSSRLMHTTKYWNNFQDIDEGKIVGWIFIVEEKGIRMKA